MSFLYHLEKCNSGVNFYIKIHQEWNTVLCDRTNKYLHTKETEHTLFFLFGFGFHGNLNSCGLLTLSLVALNHKCQVSQRH